MNPTTSKGVNLGNWLVLEKWMNPALFGHHRGRRILPCRRSSVQAVYGARIKAHRAEYINERDFATIASWG